MNQEEIQFDLLKQELELTQRQMDKYDQISSTIRTWTVTLWAASLGWSFQIEKKEIVLLSIFIAATFWILDAVNKNFRQDYKKRRDEVATALWHFFKGSKLPESIISPLLPAHEYRWRGAIKQIFKPHLFILYLSLIVVAILIFVS